ncbi:tRNA pseudouridine(55) synthase TruB [Dyella jiangningensis]|uniref:tRNA pseudouridine(55) synthase TruB n=1 Tax=Dyella jiangningensis TaxID=1379159 RepID=UPI00240EA774|nr:tRNA pseudouridine(55) synthase TruB [Dyella jiangningensis]MDG2537698.1 tRNA pseudouridine(55) synthase TruB [Dyella jiangningensis]
MSKKKSRIRFRDLHGIVLLDKPLGLSSNEALQVVRKGIFRAEKGGHTGALDPLATGLLPLCFGEATKLAGMLLGSRKAYLAECKLGATTSTADLEGEVVQVRPVPELSEADIEAALTKLRGRITQVPPVYSAIKLDGEPLYVKARRGEAVDVPSREVDVYRLELVRRSEDSLTLYVECGSGTYVRSLAVDLGEDLGCGAHLTALRRLWVDPFREPTMVTVEQLEAAAGQGDDALLALLLPVSAGLEGLPALRLDAERTLAVSQGQQIPADPALSGQYAVFGEDGRLLILGEAVDGKLRIVRGFNLPPTGQGAG